MKNIIENQTLAVHNNIQPLVITPSPVEGESLLGFILRTAELNGYGSPLKLLHYAGMDDNEARSARPPLTKLASLYGKSVAELKSQGLDSVNTKQKGRHLQLMGHAIPYMFTSSKHASLCLECLHETGIIDGFHELKYAVACPKHKVRVINTCSVCHKPLSWHRPGFKKCSCGADIAQILPEELNDPAVLALLGILYSKLMRQPLNKLEIEECGFPYSAIEQLTIQTLLSMIYRFGLFNHKQTDKMKDEDADMMAVEMTANTLSHWPQGFYQYLDEQQAPRADLVRAGLRGQFKSFYESFFKNIEDSEQLNFLRDAFIEYGNTRWKKAQLVNLGAGHDKSNVVGIYGLAKSLKIQPSTVRKLVQKCLIPSVHSDTGNRQLFDLTQLPFAFAEGESMSLKSAALKLTIPVDVLRSYRVNGFYHAKYLTVPPALFHEKDVDDLHSELMRACVLIPQYSKQRHITFEEVMRKKLGTTNVKAKFIVAVRDRIITPIGRLGEHPNSLVFDDNKVRTFIHELQHKWAGTREVQQAIEDLQVHEETLGALVKTGVLKLSMIDNEMRLIEATLIQFALDFISIQALSKIKGISTKNLLALCDAIGVVYYKVDDITKPKCGTFVPRNALSLLGVVELEKEYAEAA